MIDDCVVKYGYYLRAFSVYFAVIIYIFEGELRERPNLHTDLIGNRSRGHCVSNTYLTPTLWRVSNEIDITRINLSLWQYVANSMAYGTRRFNVEFTRTPIFSRMNAVPSYRYNFFKIHSNIVLPSPPKPSWSSLSCRLKNFKNLICGLQIPRDSHRSTRLLQLTDR